MTATFSMPVFSPALETISIFVDGELFDTVAGASKEYYSADIPTGATITVGPDETVVTTFETELIQRFRLVCQIPDTALLDDEIVSLVDFSKRQLMLEICLYSFGEEIRRIKDSYYKLPNKYIVDLNCGGTVSTLDIEFYKQQLPVYEFTEKESINVIDMNVRDGWVELDAELSGSEVMKINYYYTLRDVRYEDLLTMLSWQIASIFYSSAYTAYSIGSSNSQIKVGDVTVKYGSGEDLSINYLKDKMHKADAQLNRYLTFFKRGFYRTK